MMKKSKKQIVDEIKIGIEEMKKFSKALSVKDKAKDVRLWNTYGITIRHWNILFNEQAGVCFICQTMPKSGVLCVDHVHVKGFKTMHPVDKQKYVRGLLCFMCNTALKGFEKTVDGVRNRRSLQGTYEYFTKYPLKGETIVQNPGLSQE